MNVPIERAYQEACVALGEAIVVQRIMATEIARLQGEKDSEQERELVNGNP